MLAAVCGLTACVQQPPPNPVFISEPANATPPTGTSAAFMAPGGDYRMVSVRPAPVKDGPVLCSEPSPDWATALATSQQIAGSGGVTGGPSGSVNLSSSQQEAITALAGRTAGVVALRDGLYSACQAYANGLIGKDAYALILSQYGNLLVSLAGSSGGGGGGGGASVTSSPAATPSGVAVAVSTGSAGGAAQPPSTPGGNGGSSAGNAVVAQMQQQALQALLVACITENDRTLPDSGNNFLLGSGTCQPLLKNVAAAAIELLKPASGGTTPPPASSGGAKPNPAVAQLQTALKQKGANIAADGVMGPQTEAAMATYLSVH